jgi:hypothetical protein
MNAQHYRAAHWIQQGIFDGLRQFSEFEARVNAVLEEKDRGDADVGLSCACPQIRSMPQKS